MSHASLTLLSPAKAVVSTFCVSLYHCSQLRWKLKVPACFICSSESFMSAGGGLSQPAVSAAEPFSEGMLMRYFPTISVALDAGIPCLYAECGGGGRLRPNDLAAYRAGVQRVLAHLGMIADAPPPQEPTLRLRSGGNTDHAQAVSHAGLLLLRVRLLDPVTTGQPLGDVLDERGATLETLYAPAIGRVIMARRTASVAPGDGAYLLATEAPPDGADDPS